MFEEKKMFLPFFKTQFLNRVFKPVLITRFVTKKGKVILLLIFSFRRKVCANICVCFEFSTCLNYFFECILVHLILDAIIIGMLLKCTYIQMQSN